MSPVGKCALTWQSSLCCVTCSSGSHPWAKLVKPILWWYEDLSPRPAEHIQLLRVNISVNTLHKWPMLPYVFPGDFLPDEKTGNYSLCLRQRNLILYIFDLLIWKCGVQDQLSLGRSVHATSVTIFCAHLNQEAGTTAFFPYTHCPTTDWETDRHTHTYGPVLHLCRSNINSARFSVKQNNSLITKTVLLLFYSSAHPMVH